MNDKDSIIFQQDLQKIHSEINQLSTQRTLYTTFSVTIFGAILAYIIPKTVNPEPQPYSLFSLLFSSLAIVFIFIFFLLNSNNRKSIRVLSSYLIVKGYSQWEQDWSNFRKHTDYSLYIKAQSSIFLFLITSLTIFPFILCPIFNFTIKPIIAFIIHIIIGSILIIITFGMSYKNWFHNEEMLINLWSKTMKKTDLGEASKELSVTSDTLEKNDSWNFSSEREFMENLLNQRFNFFLIFFSLIIAGLINCKSQLHFQLILTIGTIICVLLLITIRRSQSKLDLIIDNHIKSYENHPLTIIDKEATGPSVRRFIGYIIPTVCVILLALGTFLSWLNVLSYN